MVSRRWALCLGATLVSALLSSCFEVDQVDTSGTRVAWPTLRVVDDFEAEWPTWTLLDPWTCPDWGGGPRECSRTKEANESDYALSLTFDLMGKGEYDYANAALSTDRIAVPIDVSSYENVVFSLKLAPSDAPLPDSFLVRVFFSCTGAASVGRSSDGEAVGIYSAVAPHADGIWRKYALELDEFITKTWQDEPVDPERCKKSVDSLQFEVAVDEPHVRFAGKISVDDVAFEAFDAASDPNVGRYSPWYCWGREGTTPTCVPRGRTPALSLAPDDQLSGQKQWAVLCTESIATAENHEVIGEARSLAGYASLSLAARTVTSQHSPVPDTFMVTITCDSSQPGVVLGHPIEVLPEWSSYRLDLDAFTVIYLRDSSDKAGCLAHAETLCVETNFKDDEVFEGRLELDDWVLR